MANELSTLEQTGNTALTDVDYSANAAESVSSRFADLETAKAEAPEAVDIEAPKPNPNRTLPLSATQKALLDAIADVESGGKWNVIVGGKTFNNYDDHPRVVGVVTEHGPSTAAGRYQIVATTYDDEAKRLGLKGFSPDVQDVIALNLAERNYKEATGRDIYKDLESGRVDDVRRVLAGKGAATTWQGLQKDNNFSERFNNYRKQYASGGDGWHPPMPPRKPGDNIPVDQPPAETQQTSVTSANKPAPSSVTTGVVKKDTEIEKVDTKLDDGLSGIDPAALPADLRKKYDEIKTKRAVLTERFSELQQRATARVDELQPTFEETQEYKDAFANYEKSVNDLATEVLTGVVEKTNGYNSLKLRLEHQVRNNIISVEYANKQLTDYVNKSLGSQPEYLDAKKKLDDDFNTGYKGLIETYITNDPVYQEINKEITDLQKKADEEGAVFSQEWDTIAESYNKAAQALSCGPDIPEEECQSKTPYYVKTVPSSYDIEQETNRLIKQQERAFAKDKTGKYQTDKQWEAGTREYVSKTRAATIDDLPPAVREAQDRKKQEALRREFEELSPTAFGLQYITDSITKRKEWATDDRGNYEIENQALSIYRDKLNESRSYVDSILKNRYGSRYEALLKEMNAVSAIKNSDRDFLNKAKDVNNKYSDILQDADFQFIFKQIPQYQNRALEDHKKIADKYKQNDRLIGLKEAQDSANRNPVIGAIKAFINKIGAAGLAIPGAVLETIGSSKSIDPSTKLIFGTLKEIGEDFRISATDLAATPLPEKMQGQFSERRTVTPDGHTVVWDGDTKNIAYIRRPDGTFFDGDENERKKIIDATSGIKREWGVNPQSAVGQAVESLSYMSAIIGASAVSYYTGGSGAASVAAFLASYGQIQANAYEEALSQANVRVDDGLLVANAIGLSSAVIELFNPIETAFFSKALSKSFTRSMATKYAAGEVGYNSVLWEASKNFAKSGLKEFAIEELPQHFAESTVKKYANSNLGADYKNLDLNAEQLLDLAVISIGIGGAFPAVGTLRSGRSGLGKSALESIVANPNMYEEYIEALNSTDPSLATKYRSAIDPILKEINSVPELAPNKKMKAAGILYDIRALNNEIEATTVNSIKERKLAEKSKLEAQLNKLLERPNVDIGQSRDRRNAIEALNNELQRSQETSNTNVDTVNSLDNQIAGQEMSQRIEFLETRMDNTDYIDQSEIDESVNDLYNLWDKVDSMEDLSEEQKEATKAAIENKINKLEQYEFSTTTQAGQTVKTTAVKGVRVIGRTAKETPSKFQVTPERIAGQGDTTVTRADGSTANGTFVLNDDGTIDVVIADGRTVDPRTGTVGIARIPVDSNYIEFVETQKDANGNVTGATIYDAKNNVSYTITDSDLALDMAIKAKTAALGPIEQAEFEQIIEEVERTIPARTTLKDGTEVSLSELNRRANEVANRIRQIENRLEGTISKSEKTKLKKELAKLKKERDAIQKQKTGKEVVRDRTKGRRKVGEKVQAEPKEPTGAGTAEQTEDGTQEEGGVADTKQTLMTDPIYSDAPIVRSDGKGVTSFGPDPGAVKRIMDKSGITAKIKAMLDSKLISPVEATFLESYIAEKIQNLLDRAGRTAFSTDRLGSETKMFFYSNENDFYDSINSFGVNEDGTFKYGYPGARYGANPKAVDGLYSFDQLSGIGRIDINLSSLMDAYINKLDDLQTSENPDGIPFLDFSSSINNLDKVVDKVVGHEVAHAVLFKMFGDSPKLFKELRNKIAALVKDSVLTGKLRGLLPDGEVLTIEEYLDNFSKRYNEADSYEEWLVELAGLLKMAGGLPTNAIKPTFKGKLLDILDTVISTLTGGKLRLKDYVRQDRVIEFFTSLVSSLDQYNSEEISLLRSSADAIARDAKGLLDSPQSLHFRGSLKEGQLSSTGRKPSVSSKASVKAATPKILDKKMLIGKTYSATMSDHTKIGSYKNSRTGVTVDGLMGGTMFPYIEELEKLGYVWASKDVGKARSLVKNASGVDYTLVYRMNRSTGSLGNLDTAEAALAELDYVYNKLDAAGKENFVKLLNDRLASMDSGRVLFSDKTINKKVIKYQKTDKKGNPAVGSKGNPLFAYKVPEGGGFSSYDEFKTAIKDQNLPFQTRAIWEDIFLKDDIISPKNAWHQLLKDNDGANLKELIDNLAEDVTDQAVDGDIVSVLKIAEPEYDSRGNIIVYTPFEELVNEKKGIYFAKGAPKHRTYPYFVKGKPVGLLNEFNSVYEYFPYIKEVVESGRLKHPYKAIETMMRELLATFKPITDLTVTNRKPNIQEVVEAQQKFEKNPKNANIKSKASVVTFDHTGYVSTDFWVNSLKDKTAYLDDVLKNILSARAELMAGEVSPKKVVRAYLITVASQGSAGSTYEDWSGKREKKVNDLFVEMSTDTKGKKVKWIRPEGAAAAYLSTFEGEELVDALVAQTATKQQIRKLYDFVGFGYMSDKTDNTMKTMNTGGINNMTKLFLANRGADFNELYKGAIKNFYGIGVGKTGFFNQYFGVASQGVVDARQMNAWVAGTMKLTDEQKERKAKISGSSTLQKELLDRIYKVGIALGYPADVAGYLAHHAMWDGIKNSVTTHAGEYAVVSNGFMPGSMMTLPFSDKWNLSMSEAEVEEASGETYISSQDVDPGDSKISRAKKRYLDDLYRMWGKWFTSKFPDLGNMPILDIGSGLGQVHSKFAPRKKLNISTSEPSYDSGAFKEASGMNTPTYTRHDGTDIPTEAFDFVLNSGSISEYPADTRESVIRTAARAMKPGGVSVINAMTTEYTDLLSSQIKKDPKKGIILSDSEVLVNDNGKMTYIKGFKQSELEAYVKDVLGSNYNVITAPDGLKSMATVVVEKSPEITTIRQKASVALQDVQSTAKALDGKDVSNLKIRNLDTEIEYNRGDDITSLKSAINNGLGEDRKLSRNEIEALSNLEFTVFPKQDVDRSNTDIPIIIIKKRGHSFENVQEALDYLKSQEADFTDNLSDYFEIVDGRHRVKKAIDNNLPLSTVLITEKDYEDFTNRQLFSDRNDTNNIEKILSDIGARNIEEGIEFLSKEKETTDILEKLNYLEEEKKFRDSNNANTPKSVRDRNIAEAYHKAIKDGTNPELVSAVESAVAQPTTPTIKSKPSVSSSVQPRPDQLNVMETAGKEYTDNMVDDGNGNYVFYHVAPLDLSNDFIDPKFFGRNIRTGRDEQPGVNIAMYYTEPGKVDVGGDFTHIVRIPKNMVYPFNKDPLNFYDEAKRRFRERYPALAFDANKQVGFISQVAAENGYPLVVAKWGGVSPLRAQTAVAIKPELLKDKNQVYLPEVNELKKGENPIRTKESRADVTTINKKSFESNVQSEVDRIKALPLSDVDGATFNLDGTTYTGGGLVVPVGSKNTSQKRLSAGAMYNFMMSNKDNISSSIFKNGLFKFENSPTVSIDLNIVIPREYKEIGLVFGRLAGQKSLWDMDLMEEVDTGATGENPVTYTSEQYKEIAIELAQGRIPDFVYTTAGEVAPGKTKTATGRIKSKMSAAGERGVKQFHNAVEEGISIRFLSAAKNMENRFGITEGDWLRTLPEGSSIKRILSKIKLLTGYERGSDGKWRYEISDRDAKITGESKLRKDFREDQEGVPLSEVLQHDELFKFYPELADLPVVMFRGYDFEFEAAYQRETNTMLVSNDLSGDVLKMKVLHEIQHYIQTREGFDTVGKKEMGNLQNNVLWGIGLDLDGYDSFMEAFDDALNSIQELILEGKSIVDIHDGYYTKFFFGNNPKQLMRYMVGGKAMDVLSKMSLDQQQAFFNKNILPQLDNLKSMIEDGASEVYWNNISEIEARNIEKRMNMTNQELRESIMSDTEDMARSEQIAEKGYIRKLHDFLVTQEARVEEAAAERVSPVKTKISEKPTEYLKTLLAAAVGKGVKTLSTTRRGNLTVSDFNALINGLVKYVQAQVRNAVASNNSYRLSDLIDDVRSVSSVDVDIATAAALFDEAGVTGTTFDPKIEEDVMRKSLIDAGFPPQMAAMLAKGDALYDYANSNRITKKSC